VIQTIIQVMEVDTVEPAVLTHTYTIQEHPTVDIVEAIARPLEEHGIAFGVQVTRGTPSN